MSEVENFPVSNTGTTIGIGLRPTVESIGSSFFVNTVTIQTVTKHQNDMGEETLEYTTILEHVPAMITKAELNAGREETNVGDLELTVRTVDVMLNGYHPEITLNARMIVEQFEEGMTAPIYDIVGIDHPAIAFTTLVAILTNPTGVQE